MGKPGRGAAGREADDASSAWSAAPATQTVRVWLYGALSRLSHERPLMVEVPRGISVGDMIERLGRDLGSGLIEDVMEAPCRKRNVCRIFLNGTVAGLDDRLTPSSATAELEMIMLTAIEGG